MSRTSSLFVTAYLITLVAPLCLPQTSDEQRWIERLKSTPLTKLDVSLPAVPFGEWFAEHTKGRNAQYRVEPCEDRDYGTEYRGKGLLRCVVLTSGTPASRLRLNFIVAVAQKGISPRPVDPKFLIGGEGPTPESHILRPERILFKLSDLQTKLGWE